MDMQQTSQLKNHSANFLVQSFSLVQLFATPWAVAHKLPCLSLSLRICSNSCPLSWWCHSTTSSPVTPFSSCPLSFPESGSFPMRWFFASGGQSIRTSAPASVLLRNIQGWFYLGLTCLIPLQSKTLKSLLQHHNSKASILWHSAFFMVQLSHPYITTGKTIGLMMWNFVGKMMSLIFNALSRLVIGEGNGTPLQYSCIENPTDWGAWKASVHGVAEGPTQLSNFTFTFHFYALEKEMTTHSCVLAWRIPGTGKPGGLLSVGSHRVGHDWSDLAIAIGLS